MFVLVCIYSHQHQFLRHVFMLPSSQKASLVSSSSHFQRYNNIYVSVSCLIYSLFFEKIIYILVLIMLTDSLWFVQFPPCYKDMSFWINDTFTENNLCEVVRGIAGDLVEEVRQQCIRCILAQLSHFKFIRSFSFPIVISCNNLIKQ